jgi:hypothetical protein
MLLHNEHCCIYTKLPRAVELLLYRGKSFEVPLEYLIVMTHFAIWIGSRQTTRYELLASGPPLVVVRLPHSIHRMHAMAKMPHNLTHTHTPPARLESRCLPTAPATCLATARALSASRQPRSCPRR